MKFTIYFEFFGRKMKHEVDADSVDQAKQNIKDKIKFFDNVKKEQTIEELNIEYKMLWDKFFEFKMN